MARLQLALFHAGQEVLTSAGWEPRIVSLRFKKSVAPKARAYYNK